LHETSITNSGRLHAQSTASLARRFRVLIGRDPKGTDRIARVFWLIAKYLRCPMALVERLRHGPVYRRGIR
jgi:hypothetical protein